MGSYLLMSVGSFVTDPIQICTCSPMLWKAPSSMPFLHSLPQTSAAMLESSAESICPEEQHAKATVAKLCASGQLNTLTGRTSCYICFSSSLFRRGARRDPREKDIFEGPSKDYMEQLSYDISIRQSALRPSCLKVLRKMQNRNIEPALCL